MSGLSETVDEGRLVRLEERLKTVADDMNEVKESLKDISISLKTLAVLEEKHNTTTEAIKRAFIIIDNHGERLEDIEKSIPYLKLASGWLFKGIIFVMSILGAAAIATVFKGVLK